MRAASRTSRNLRSALALTRSGGVVSATAFCVLTAHAQTPAAAPATAPAPPPPVTITGTVEANYTANFNKPYNSSNTYLYNTNEGQFSLNLADLRISKAATPTSRYGFMVRPIGGEVARRNFNSADYSGGPGVAILEGYGTILVPMGGKDLKVDAGQFVTHVGYETIEIGTNNFFSRNFLFQYPSPFYDAGVRASLPVSPTTTVSGYIYNRYNGTADPGNRDLAPGFQIAFNPNAATSIVLNGLTSRDNLANSGATNEDGTYQLNNKQQSVLDLIFSKQFTPMVKFVGEGLWRFGKDVSNDSYDIGGGAGYLIFNLKSGNVLSFRGEYLSPFASLGYAGGPAPSLASGTVSYELKSGLFPGSRTFFEYRFDKAGKDYFPGEHAGDLKKNQSTLTLGQVINF